MVLKNPICLDAVKIAFLTHWEDFKILYKKKFIFHKYDLHHLLLEMLEYFIFLHFVKFKSLLPIDTFGKIEFKLARWLWKKVEMQSFHIHGRTDGQDT
jgi:hypothetical protein